MNTIQTPNLLDRFCRYVRINTEAVENAGTYPSSPGQLELGRMLLQELTDLGLKDAKQSVHGIVTATIPATISNPAPTIALFAHLDTSPETTGKNVKPIVHAEYDGRDIVLPGDPTKILRSADNVELQRCVGKTVITTDGTTLLGADNKAGVAVIMEAAAYLLQQPEIPHGPIRICFTCDEEIGHGVDHVDLTALGAVVGYTLDGAGEGEIEAETFSADKADVTFTGINIHPSIGKGKMVNAIRMVGSFLDSLPRELAPEMTEGREGFIHPYTIEGGVGKVTVGFLLRDFVTAKLEEQAELLREKARMIERQFPKSKVEVVVRPQYRNMADGMKSEPRAVAYAVEAMTAAGLTPKIGSIRGGTDGSQLTAKGLPTPNLSTAEHHIHSPLEWTCLEEMQSAVRVLVELAKRWGRS
ncbi:MAG: peptidase T [Planctomycetes bacterium]|nr:peptidase T [Planctomycetota bacterium]